MKKNNGFTLIELIAVIVMMGMILLIVFPAMSRLLKSNEEKRFDSYYDSVQEALELYARTRRDELGGIRGNGCVDDKKLSDLKEYDYIQEYTEEENVTCLSPSDFTTDQLNALGIDTSKQYNNVRINNKKGSISVKYSMICVRNYNDPGTMSLLYSNLDEKKETCTQYVPEEFNSLEKKLYETSSDYYENQNIAYFPENNFVLYSGRLWSAIYYDKTKKEIKLVSDENVAITSYNNASSGKRNDFSDSNIYKWLKNVFLPTLRNPERYLVNTKWNYASYKLNGGYIGGFDNGPTVVSKIGLLTVSEFKDLFSHFSSDESFWLISPSGENGNTNDNAWVGYRNEDVVANDVSKFFGVRPVIVMKSNVMVENGGTGTKENPIKISGEASGKVGAKLNSRYPGEYVTINNNIFRISSNTARYTKLISNELIDIDEEKVSTIPNITEDDYGYRIIGFHYYDTSYSDNTFIGSYLQMWAELFMDLLTEGDFCRKPIIRSELQIGECSSEYIFNSKAAIPRVGDMYAVSKGYPYWTTSDPVNNKYILIDGESNSESIREIQINSKATVVPVIVIKNSATITGGNGTINSPYTIE